MEPQIDDELRLRYLQAQRRMLPVTLGVDDDDDGVEDHGDFNADDVEGELKLYTRLHDEEAFDDWLSMGVPTTVESTIADADLKVSMEQERRKQEQEERMKAAREAAAAAGGDDGAMGWDAFRSLMFTTGMSQHKAGKARSRRVSVAAGIEVQVVQEGSGSDEDAKDLSFEQHVADFERKLLATRGAVIRARQQIQARCDALELDDLSAFTRRVHQLLLSVMQLELAPRSVLIDETAKSCAGSTVDEPPVLADRVVLSSSANDSTMVRASPDGSLLASSDAPPPPPPRGLRYDEAFGSELELSSEQRDAITRTIQHAEDLSQVIFEAELVYDNVEVELKAAKAMDEATARAREDVIAGCVLASEEHRELSDHVLHLKLALNAFDAFRKHRAGVLAELNTTLQRMDNATHGIRFGVAFADRHDALDAQDDATCMRFVTDLVGQLDRLHHTPMPVDCHAQWQQRVLDAGFQTLHVLSAQHLTLSLSEVHIACSSTKSAERVRDWVKNDRLTMPEIAYRQLRHDNFRLGVALCITARYMLGELGPEHDLDWGFRYW